MSVPHLPATSVLGLRVLLVTVALVAGGVRPAIAQLPSIPDVKTPSVPDLPVDDGAGVPSVPKVPKVPSSPVPTPSVPVSPGPDAVTGAVDTVRETVGSVTEPVRQTPGGGSQPGASPSGGGAASPSPDGDDGGRRTGPASTSDAANRPRSVDGASEPFDAEVDRTGGPGGADETAARGGPAQADGTGRIAESDGGERRARAGGAARTTDPEDAARARVGAAGAGDALPVVDLSPSAARTDGDGGGAGGTGVLAALGDGIDRLLRPLPDWSRPIIAALVLLVLVLSARSVVVAARIRRLQHGHTALAGDLAVLQHALVPPLPERLGGLDLTVAYRAADGLAAGGDFYDAFALDEERTALILGDVSGHDRTAIARAASVRHKLRAYLELGMEPRAALRAAGEALASDTPDGEFVTAVVAVHDRATDTLTYACAGHPPPILVGPAAHAPLVAGAAPALGWGLPTGQRQTSVTLGAGSTACMFTDGLLEARRGEEQLGRERLTELLDELDDAGRAADLLESVVRSSDRADDDLAALVVRPHDAGPAPAHRVEELELPGGTAGVQRAGRTLDAWGLSDEPAIERAVAALAAAPAGEGVVLRVCFGADGVVVDASADVTADAAAAVLA